MLERLEKTTAKVCPKISFLEPELTPPNNVRPVPGGMFRKTPTRSDFWGRFKQHLLEVTLGERPFVEKVKEHLRKVSTSETPLESTAV